MKIKKYLSSFIAFFLIFTIATSYIDPYILNYPLSATTFLFLTLATIYSAGISIISTYLWEKGLKSGLVVSTALIIYFAAAGRLPDIFYGTTRSVEFIGTALALLSVNIVISSAEYIYKNRNSLKPTPKDRNIQYSLLAGWLHTVFSFCLAIFTYGPSHVDKFFFSLRFLTGFTGTFLLGALPVYLYLEGKEKLPVIMTGLWIGWGIISFMLEFEDLPVNEFFPAPEFFIPPAPGYLFSSYLMLSIIVVYIGLRRVNAVEKLKDRIR